MRFGLVFALVSLILVADAIRAQSPAPDPAALQKRLTELEERITTLQRDAAELRKQLDKLAPPKVVIMTPQEAVDAHKKNPNQPVAVEFGAEEGSGAFRTGIGPDGDAIVATWDGRFPGGGTFTAILHPKAYVELKIPSKEKGKDAVKPPPGSERDVVGRHIDEHGLRVTGLVRQSEPWFGVTNYYIEVDDPSKVVLYISVAPRPVRQR